MPPLPDLFVLRGPAGAGKTAFLLDRLAERLPSGPGRALWIAPDRTARESVHERLRLRNVPLAGFEVLTFPEWAGRIARADRPAARDCPDLHQRLLLDGLLAELSDGDELPAFGAASTSPGFADAALELLRELRGQGIDAAAWRDSLAALRDPGGRLSAITRIVGRYQRRLTELGWEDRPQSYRLAIDRVRAGQRRPFERVELLIVDDFAEFTPPQRELLAAFLPGVPLAWLTLPLDPPDDDARSELFARPLATLTALYDLPHREMREVPIPVATDEKPAGLRTLERELFRDREGESDNGECEGIESIEAPGALGEVRLVARDIKRRLLAGESANSFVVAAPLLGPYAPLLTELFREYGIPHTVDHAEPLAGHPWIGTLLRAVGLAEDGFPFAATTALLRSSLVKPSWHETRREPTVAALTEQLLRLLGETSGRDRYLQAVEAWATRPPEPLEDEAGEGARRRRQSQLSERCLPFLRKFLACWDSMPAREPLDAFIKWLDQFARDLGLLGKTATPADRKVWGQLHNDLVEWAAQERALGRQRPTHTAASFRKLLHALAAGKQNRPEPTGQAQVRCLSADNARHASADTLYVLGLGERGFPRLSKPETVLSESERQELRGSGLDLETAADRLPREMLLFYQLCSRARRRLVLCYPAVDEKGQELLPSAFLLAVRDLFAAKAIPAQRQRMLIEGYDTDEPLCPAEFRVRAALEWSPRTSLLLDAALADQLAGARSLARHRFEERDHSRYDGFITNPAAVARIVERFGPDKVFSPTALEAYIDCPFKFLLGHVLKLEPLRDPADEVETTRRGQAFHRALSRLHQTHTAPNDAVADDLRAEMRRAVAEDASRTESPVARALWALEGERLDRAAARYGDHWAKFHKPWVDGQATLAPTHFELPFGLMAEPGKPDVAPLIVRDGDTEVRIGGRIDRVDVTQLPDGGTGFYVIDYKTGKGSAYTGQALTDLVRLQLPLYAVAVEQLVGEGLRPLGMAYWLVTESGAKHVLPAGRGSKATQWLLDAAAWPDYRVRLEAWVARLVASIRQGRFPLHPRQRDCTRGCAFGHACRIAQSRRNLKAWELAVGDDVVGEV